MTIICDANLEGALRQSAHVNLAVKDIREAFGREPRSALYRINAGMRFALSFLQLNHQKTIFPELVPYWQSVKSMIEIRSLIGNKHYPSTRSLGDLKPPEATLLLRFMEVEDAAKKILLPEKANTDGSYTITVPKGDYVLSKAGDTITLPKKLAEVRAEMRAAYDDLYAGYVAAMKVKLGFDPASTPADMRAADREDAAKVIEMLQELYHPGYVSHTRQGRYGLKYTKDGREMFEAIQGSGVTIAAQERDSLRLMEALRARLLADPTATKVGKIFDVRNLDDIYNNLPDTGYLENISMVLQALVAPARGEARETVENLIKKLTELAEKRKTGKLQARRDVGGWLTPENASTYLKSTYPSYLFTMSNAIARVATERQRSAAIADIPARDVRKLAEDHNEYLYSDESQEAAIRALAFYYTLGGNISSSVMQLTQTPQVGIPFFAPHAGVGRTVATMARASTEVLQAFKLALRADKVFTPERLKVPAEEKEMIQRMMDRGILQPMVTQDEAPALMERHSSEAINALGRKFGKLLEVMGLGFRATEQASRMITAITAYRLTANPEVLASIKRVAASVGDVVNTRDDAVKFAVEKVNFFQGPELRAKAFRGYASIPFQFQSFPVNMLMNWVEAAMYYGGKGVFKSPEGRQMLSLLVMGIFMTSGVWGLPFASSLADLLDFLSEQVAKTPLGAAMGLSPTATKAQLQRTLAEIFKEVPLLAQEGDAHELASLFFNGPFRLSGADISKRAGLEIIQGNPLQMDIFSFGPFGGAVLGGAKDASNYMSKDMPLMALASLFPIAVRNFARAYEMRESGYVTPGKIEPALPASELQGIPEAISVALGFTPAKIAEAREAKMEAKELGQRMDAVRKSYSDSIATNLAKAAQAKNPADARSYEERAQRLFEEIARRDEGKEPDARILVDTQAFNTSIRNKITQYLVPESGKGVPKVTRGEYLERVQGG